GPIGNESRNEAHETHYENHLELLKVTHGRAETALVDELNGLVVVADQHSLTRAMDRRGHDVTGPLAAEDGNVYRTAAQTMEQAQLPGLDDLIDPAAPAPPAAARVARGLGPPD